MNSIIAGGFTSHRTVWFLGGALLKSSLDYLLVLRNLYDEGREKAPFFDNFDIEYFTSLHENPLFRIHQAFYQALNTKGQLPSLIVFMIDPDMFMAPELYLPSELEAHLRWFFDDMDQALKNRRRNMPLRSLNQGEPHVYVIKAIPRCNIGTDPNYLIYQDRHQKFNILLQAIGRCYAVGTINIHTITADDTRCFKPTDGTSLDTRGFYRLWRELLSTMADILHEMDREKRKRIFQEEEKQRFLQRQHRNDRH